MAINWSTVCESTICRQADVVFIFATKDGMVLPDCVITSLTVSLDAVERQAVTPMSHLFTLKNVKLSMIIPLVSPPVHTPILTVPIVVLYYNTSRLSFP